MELVLDELDALLLFQESRLNSVHFLARIRKTSRFSACVSFMVRTGAGRDLLALSMLALQIVKGSSFLDSKMAARPSGP